MPPPKHGTEGLDAAAGDPREFPADRKPLMSGTRGRAADGADGHGGPDRLPAEEPIVTDVDEFIETLRADRQGWSLMDPALGRSSVSAAGRPQCPLDPSASGKAGVELMGEGRVQCRHRRGSGWPKGRWRSTSGHIWPSCVSRRPTRWESSRVLAWSHSRPLADGPGAVRPKAEHGTRTAAGTNLVIGRNRRRGSLRISSE